MARRFKKRSAPVVGHGNRDGSPRCCDSFDNLMFIAFRLGEGFGAFFLVVFGTFNALQYRLHSSRHDENDTFAGPIVCRAELGAILNGDAARSAGADVNQATAALESRYGVLYGGTDRRQGRPYGCTRGELSVIDGGDHVAGGP